MGSNCFGIFWASNLENSLINGLHTSVQLFVDTNAKDKKLSRISNSSFYKKDKIISITSKTAQLIVLTQW